MEHSKQVEEPNQIGKNKTNLQTRANITRIPSRTRRVKTRQNN